MTKVESIIGHSVDYNGVGALSGQWHIQSKNTPPPPPTHQKEICIFLLVTWNLYSREIIFVTDVAVLTIETIKPAFKLLVMKQSHFLKPLNIFITLLKYAMRIWNKYFISKAQEKRNIEGRERGCWQSMYQGTKTRGFSLQNKTFSALNYAQDFGTTVKESLKRTTNSKWATLTRSRIVPC